MDLIMQPMHHKIIIAYDVLRAKKDLSFNVTKYLIFFLQILSKIFCYLGALNKVL